MKRILVLAASGLVVLVAHNSSYAANATVSANAAPTPTATAPSTANVTVNTGAAPTASPSRIYAVTKVAPDDGLNMRTQPGTGGSIVAVLPANAKGLIVLGQEQKTGNSVWVKVAWAGRQGWVNKYYLREDVDTVNYNPATTKPVVKPEVVMQCGGTEPFWSMSISERDMKVNIMGGAQFTVPVNMRQQSANSTTIAVVAGMRGNASTTAFLEKVENCSDGMSDKNYPYTITTVLNGQQVMSGCCSIVSVTK
ncbi:SH3 domain-containing protein [Thiothrix eikelboomii]|uniref:SH3 domain-containing protein n=1 Tax=Thiothrix eikelboomii TaxID=92487 RepID=A0A1T4XVJ3_9GAMM|nr:SH3 domain-containing protein [Thiothrix eikelboomii]SKA93599.1 SH3 domain-containing protein [Thiothrix eikelboomii]